jgi:Fe-S cluster biogenesis protein NfuA
MSDEPRRQPLTESAANLALDPIRARLRSHGGDVQVRDVDATGVVSLEFIGACRGCPALAFTYSAVVHPALVETPGVTRVDCHQTRHSDRIIRRIAEIRGSASPDLAVSAATS